MSFPERLYRALLTLLPPDFRAQAGEEMVAVFRDGWRQARRSGTVRARLRFWLLTLYDLLLTTRHARTRGQAAVPGPRPTFPDEGNPMLATVIKDLRFALRTLLRSPGTAVVVILTLALGIGANTAVFSVVDGILLRPLPLPESGELVAIWADYTRREGPLKEWLSYPNFDDARQLDVFDEVGTWTGWGPTLTGRGDQPELLVGAQVSRGMLAEVLGVSPAAGRGFSPEEDLPNAAPVVLLSHDLWTRIFAADPSVIGDTLTLDGEPHSIIGVMPDGFRPPFVPRAEVWRPLRVDLGSGGGRGEARFRVIGRLADGTDLATARAALDALGSRLEAEYPEDNTGVGYYALPLRDDIVEVAATALWVLLGAVGFVLLMACVNVANLVLAQATTRTGELAVRAALGAGRGRILRQLLTENLVLAVVGGLLGAFLGWIGTRYLVSLAPPQTPRIAEVGVDARVLGFTAAASLASVLVFGLLPALRVAGSDLHDALKEGGRGRDAGSQGRALRSSLVVVQVALALVLLIGAGLLVRTFEQLRAVDLGFDPEGVLAVSLNLPPARYGDRGEVTAFYGELERRLQSLPGVQSVGLVNTVPLSGNDGDATFHIEGRPLPAPGQQKAAWIRRVTPDYLPTMGIELLAGRGFEPGDDAEAARVVIVNETIARELFPDEDPVGRRVYFGDPADPDPTYRQIVGVAADIKNFGIAEGSRYAIYFPYYQVPSGFMSAMVRVAGDPESLVPAIRREIAELDPDLAVAGFTTMESMVSDSMAPERFVATLMTAFAGVALALAVVGLYGVVSYGVGLRMHEMGVRVALGAGGQEIGRLVVGSSLVLIGVGVVAGLLGAVFLTRLMSGLLYGVSATDPLTFGAVVAVLAGAGLVASVLPARRAARVDPVTVLNRE